MIVPELNNTLILSHILENNFYNCLNVDYIIELTLRIAGYTTMGDHANVLA